VTHKYAGGCDHIHTHSDNDPIDNYICHCSVCKGIIGQDSTHVVFFNHGVMAVDNADGLNRQLFNGQNPDGPLDLCTCATCGVPIMLDDREERIRVVVPILMGLRPGQPASDLPCLLRTGRRCSCTGRRSSRP
jgi:hypothetical protein